MMSKWRYLIPFVIFLMVGYFSGCSKKPHQVHISSSPAGAMILLNDRVIGETPFDLTMAQRKNDYSCYIFRAVKEDYLPARKSYKEQLYYETVYDVVPENVHFALQQRVRYKIHVTSYPPGAIVLVNGEVSGETPFDLTIKERIGSVRVFEILIVKDGFKKATEVIREFLPQENGAVFQFPEAIHVDLETE